MITGSKAKHFFNNGPTPFFKNNFKPRILPKTHMKAITLNGVFQGKEHLTRPNPVPTFRC
jgi:hypothetical protein